MAKEVLEDNGSQYSGFERFLFFATPILFTIVLLVVLLTLFNVDWRNNILNWAQDVPVINKVLPAPDEKEADKDSKDKKPKEAVPTEAEQIADLKKLLASKDNDLRVLAEKRKTLEDEVNKLSQQVNQSAQKQEQQRVNAEQYDKQVKDLAGMYAKMMPSKAAPILENLTKEEIVLVLHAMKQEERVKILEKMNPKTAAEASIQLKDVQTSDNLKIAALQARLKKNETTVPATTGLDKAQLSKTFSSMSPKSGASILLETSRINPGKVLAVLNAVDDATRSKLIDAMTEADKTATAKLVSKLFPNK
nr:primosomal protein [Paenibacillus taiwanensis]